jgi:hypothetical protein
MYREVHELVSQQVSISNIYLHYSTTKLEPRFDLHQNTMFQVECSF